MPFYVYWMENLIDTEQGSVILNLWFFIDLGNQISSAIKYLIWCIQRLLWKITIKCFPWPFVLIWIFCISDMMECKVLVCILDHRQLEIIYQWRIPDLSKFNTKLVFKFSYFTQVILLILNTHHCIRKPEKIGNNW